MARTENGHFFQTGDQRKDFVLIRIFILFQFNKVSIILEFFFQIKKIKYENKLYNLKLFFKFNK